MMIDFSQKLKDLQGMVITEQPGNPKTLPVTLGTLAVNALMLSEDRIDGTEKVRRYDLGVKIFQRQDDLVELDCDDLALIKRLIGNMYGPLYVGQAWKMLES